jgi:hypothetical protein
VLGENNLTEIKNLQTEKQAVYTYLELFTSYKIIRSKQGQNDKNVQYWISKGLE